VTALTGEPAPPPEPYLSETGHRYDVTESSTIYTGRVITIRRDLVRMPDDTVSQRDVVVHPGAVGVVAIDDDGRVVMVRQYRHPVRRPLWELPAGLLDVPGEPAWIAAARELAEEARLRAARWDVLTDLLVSPGMTDEAYRVYLARGLSDIPPEQRHVGEFEEAEMEVHRLPLDEAVRQVFAGEIDNSMAVVGILAAAHALREGFGGLRSARTPWPARPGHSGEGWPEN
jgi:8-oxo-dGTP pyrophosphatase MutT (NUDIX family)